MKKIFFLIGLLASLSASAQFPNRDSLQRYINRWVRNNAAESFTNLRLNTVLNGLLREIDSVGIFNSGIAQMIVENDSLKIITTAEDTFAVQLPAGSGSTNLSVTRTGTTVTVIPSSGTSANIPGATQSLAGILTAADKITLDSAAPRSLLRDSVNTRLYNIYRRSDSIFYIKSGAEIFAYKDSVGGAGTGTVTHVATGYGLSGGPITTTGTISTDTSTLSGKYLRRADSTLYSTVTRLDTANANIRALVATKLSNITGLVTPGTGIAISGSGTSGSPYIISSAVSGGTVTSVGSGYGLTGGPITGAGTLVVDTATLSNKWLRRADTSVIFSDYRTALNGRVRYSDTSSMLSAYRTALNARLQNITAYIEAGANITLDGSGTLADPYVINGSSGGGGGSDNGMVGAGFRPLANGTQNLRTLFGSTQIAIDSTTNTNGLTFSIPDNTITNAKINSVAWSKVTGAPAFITNLTGYLSAGTNVVIDGDGTSVSPYIINGIASNNTMAGSGFRPLWAGTQALRTYFGSNTITLDSTSNTNGLTWKADTSVLATQYDLTQVAGTTYIGTANRISIVGGTQIDIASTYAGQNTINTVGTVVTGTWNANKIGMAYGGVPTGGTTGQVLAKVNNSDNNLEWITVSSGGGGEANTASNIGSGVNIFKDKVGVDLQFKKLNNPDELIVLTSNENDISITLDTATTLSDYRSALNARQPLDADLTTIAGLGPTNDDIVQRKSGAWTNRTMAQLAADLPVFSSSAKGSVPASGGGTTTYLRADGTFATPPGSSYTFNSGLTETGGTASIATNGVTTTKIADANVTDDKLATGINANKLGDGSVSTTEFQYINSLTSNAQTQIDSKLGTSLNSAQLFVGNGSNIATAVTMSGYGSLDNTGGLTIRDATTSVKGAASFATGDFTVSSGAVTTKSFIKKLTGRQVVMEQPAGISGNNWVWIRTPDSYSYTGKPHKLAILYHGNGWTIDGTLATANASSRTQYGVDDSNGGAYLSGGGDPLYVEYSSPLIENLLAQGYVVAGSQNFGDNLYGNDDCRRAAVEFYDYMQGAFNVETKIYMVGFSNGAMTALNTIPLLGESKVAAFVGLYPLTNLIDHYLNYAPHQEQIEDAYGISPYTDKADMLKDRKLFGHDPVNMDVVQLGASYSTTVKNIRFPPIYLIASHGDAVVDIDYNSIPLRDLLDRSRMQVILDDIDPTGGLGYDHGDYHHFKVTEILDFFETLNGSTGIAAAMPTGSGGGGGESFWGDIGSGVIDYNAASAGLNQNGDGADGTRFFTVRSDGSGAPAFLLNMDGTTGAVFGLQRTDGQFMNGALANDVIARTASGAGFAIGQSGASEAFLRFNSSGALQLPQITGGSGQYLAVDASGNITAGTPSGGGSGYWTDAGSGRIDYSGGHVSVGKESGTGTRILYVNTITSGSPLAVFQLDNSNAGVFGVGRGANDLFAGHGAGDMLLRTEAGKGIAFGQMDGGSGITLQRFDGSGNLSFPQMTGGTNYFLAIDASGNVTPALVSGGGGGGTPGGSDGAIQYNSSGSFAGPSEYIWRTSTKTAVVNGALEAGAGFAIEDNDGGFFSAIQSTSTSGLFQPIFSGYGTGAVSSLIFKALRSTSATDGSSGTATMRIITRESDDATAIGASDVALRVDNGSTTTLSLLGDGTLTLPKYAGSGSGYLAVDNNGVVSWGAGGSGMSNPMTTQGDMIVGGSSGTPTRVAAGTLGYVWTANGAGATPSWQPLAFASGVYTPTITGVINLATYEDYECSYMRVGDVVHVQGKVDLDPTTTGVVLVRISIPVSNSFGNDYEGSGSGLRMSFGENVGMYADTANGAMYLTFNATNAGNASVHFIFTYKLNAD